MRLAMLCPYLPAPPISGGRIRMFELARALAREHEVVLFAAAAQEELDVPAAKASVGAFSQVHLGLSPWRRFPILNVPRRVVRLSSLRSTLRAEHAKAPFALAVVEHSHAAKPALDENLRFLVDEHNIESDYLHSRASALRRRGWLESRDQALSQTWERMVWHQAEAVVCVSQADAAVVRNEAPETPVSVVPNGVDWQGTSFRPPSLRRTKTVLFVGMMDHPPNVAAAQMLAEQVMPRVWRDCPEAKLVLCGHKPASEVARLAGPRVEVTGTVPSVQPYLDEAAVIVNPLRHGAGTSLKVLEALASGAPLVTTDVGVRGYDTPIRTACLIANTADDMAQAIVRCLRFPGDDEQAGRRRAAAADYDWARLSARFCAEVRARADPGRKTPGTHT